MLSPLLPREGSQTAGLWQHKGCLKQQTSGMSKQPRRNRCPTDSASELVEYVRVEASSTAWFPPPILKWEQSADWACSENPCIALFFRLSLVNICSRMHTSHSSNVPTMLSIMAHTARRARSLSLSQAGIKTENSVAESSDLFMQWTSQQCSIVLCLGCHSFHDNNNNHHCCWTQAA